MAQPTPVQRTPEEEAAKTSQETLIANGCRSIYTADYNTPFPSYRKALEQLLPYHLFSDIDPQEADIDEADDKAGRTLLMSREHVWRDHVLRKAHAAIAAVEPIAADMTERLKEEQNGKRKRGYEEYMAERWMQDMRRPYEDRTRLEIAELTAELDGLEQQRLARENPQAALLAAQQAAAIQAAALKAQPSFAPHQPPGSASLGSTLLQYQQQQQQPQQLAHLQQQARAPQGGVGQDVASRMAAEQVARDKARLEKEARDRLALLEQQKRAAAAGQQKRAVATGLQPRPAIMQAQQAPIQHSLLAQQARLAQERESLARAGASQGERAWPGQEAAASADAKERERLLRERDAQARVAQFQRQQQQQQQR